MPLQFACAGCGKKYSVAETHAGKQVQCKACGTMMRVPQAKAKPAAEAPDLFGMDDDIVDEDGDEGASYDQPIRRSGASGRGDSGGGVPIAIFIGGGVILLLVLVVGLVMMNGSKPAPAPDAADAAPVAENKPEPVEDAAPAPTAPIIKPFAKKKAITGTGSPWNVKPDPGPPVELGANVKWTIPIPESFSQNDVIYPRALSPFVLVGGNDNANQTRELWDMREPSKVGVLRGDIETAKPMILSADGSYFATHTHPVPRMTDVWNLADGKRIARIPDGERIPDVLAFVGADKILIGTTYAKRLEVWNFITNKSLFKIDTPDGWSSRPKAFTVSPTGKNVAIMAGQQIVIYEMDGGKLVGTLPVPRVDGEDNVSPEGVAFSPDGTALSALVKFAFNPPRIVTWDLTTGSFESDLRKPGYAGLKESFGYDTRGIEWLPDSSGWLIYDQTIIERKTGQIIWTIPFDPKRQLEDGPRRILDGEHVVVVSKGRSTKVLRIETMPRDKVQGAIALVKSGGNAVDASLPAIKTPDRASVKKITFPATAPAWKVPVEVVSNPKKPTARPIGVRINSVEVLGLHMAGPDSSQAVIEAGPDGKIAQEGKSTDIGGSQNRIERVDISTGSSLGRFQIPSASEVVALNPSGTSVLLLTGIERDRLDLHNAADGKHVVGWRPFDTETGENRQIVSAAFVSDKNVLTMSKSGTLTLWSVPDAKAIYTLERAGLGAAAVGPTRKTVVIFRDNALVFLDANTGEPLGASQPLGASGFTGLQAAALRADGKELAAVVNETVVRLDMTTGKPIEEFVSPIPNAKSIQYGGPKFLVVDGRQVFEIAAKRIVWNFSGGIHARNNPDGLHWAIPRIIGQQTSLRSYEVPSADLNAALAAEASPKTKVLIKEGATVAIEIQGTPPRDNEGFRRTLTAGLAAQLEKLGAKAGNGGAGKLVASFQDRETGNTIELTLFGGRTGAPEKRNVPERELTSRLTLSDGGGTPITLFEFRSGSRLFGLQGLPQGENDWDGYLRNNVWRGSAKALSERALPYFIGRTASSTAILPGFTQLGLQFQRAE